MSASRPFVELLDDSLDRAEPLLRAMSDAESARSRAPGKWSPREIIGHLIDSATNNQGRFLRAATQEDLVFPGYEQETWVAMQRYATAPWNDLLTLWLLLNRHLSKVMEHLPDDAGTRPRARHNLDQIAWKTLPADRPATLDYFMEDYVGHLRHHLRQILGAQWDAVADLAGKHLRIPGDIQALAALVESQGGARSVRILNAGDGALRELPDAIGDLRQLTRLYLHENHLRSLPESLGSLPGLTHLDIAHNRLTSLPVSLGNLSHLQFLYVSNNRLTGVEFDLGLLRELQYLNLADNHLRSLPDAVGELVQLVELRLYSNQIEALARLDRKSPVATRVIRGEQFPPVAAGLRWWTSGAAKAAALSQCDNVPSGEYRRASPAHFSGSSRERSRSTSRDAGRSREPRTPRPAIEQADESPGRAGLPAASREAGSAVESRAVCPRLARRTRRARVHRLHLNGRLGDAAT